MGQKEDLEERIRQLSRTVEEMKVRMAALESAEPESNNGKSRSSRRGFLRLGAAAALGGLGLAAGKIVPASAATGGNFTLGQANLAENPTTIQGDGGTPPTQVLAAEDSTFSQTALTGAGGFTGTLQGLGAASGSVEGVDGWAQGSQAFGVYGLTDAGYGVTGESNTGISLYARRSGRILQDPLVAAGMPTQLANDFEQVRDAAGAMWISGPGSTWKQVATTDLGFHVFPNPRRIVDGFAHPMTSGVTYGPFDATLESDLTTPTGVPVGAQAAWCAVQSYTPGVLTLFPDGGVDPGSANWSGTGNLGASLNMLYMLVPLSSAGKFKIHSYITGKIFVDAWGFLR